MECAVVYRIFFDINVRECPFWLMVGDQSGPQVMCPLPDQIFGCFKSITGGAAMRRHERARST